MSVSRLTTPSETTTDDTRAAGRRVPDARAPDALVPDPRLDDDEPAGRSRRLRYTSALCRERPGDAQLRAAADALPQGEDEPVVVPDERRGRRPRTGGGV